MRSTSFIYLLLASWGAALLAAPAAADDRTGWRLKLGAASFHPTSGGGFDPSFGGGLAVEYRATPRLGVELGVMTSEVVSERTFDEPMIALRLLIESRIETTPVLARLNWNLTPRSRADFYVGPVVGWVSYGDVKIRVRGDIEPINLIDRSDTDDGFAWGGHAGLDAPLGDGGWFFNSGLTFLQAEVEQASTGATLFDLNPLIAHVGIGYRF